MGDFFAFRKMITPALIQIIFWIGVAVTMLSGLAALFSGNILGGLASLVLGPLVIRVWCELVMLLFRINDNLAAIREAGAPKA